LARLLIGRRGGLGGALFHGVANRALARRHECLRYWGRPVLNYWSGIIQLSLVVNGKTRKALATRQHYDCRRYAEGDDGDVSHQ
jgi:hypothetical protein